MQKLSRRNFLQRAAAGSLALGGGLTSFLSTTAARAANNDGYKAIVCLYLDGGLDNYDTILPYDRASYDGYAAIRQSLLSQYESAAGGSTRRFDRLLPLSPRNSADFGGRAFAMTEEMAPLHSLFQREKASIIANVGPLIEPMNRSQFESGSRARPPRLFSHNDQKSAWLALAPEGAREGWGGRFCDAALSANANTQPRFTAVSLTGNEVFLSGANTQQFTISTGTAETVREFNYRSEAFTGNARLNPLVHQLIEEHFRTDGAERANIYERDLASLRSSGIAASEAYREAQLGAPDLGVTFENSRFGREMEAVARMISIHNAIGAQRQIFMVTLSGFDSHAGQATGLPRAQRQVAQAISSFQTAMERLGLENNVTLFTASDFGRTLSINGDGSDHGWGGHQFVVGGAVNGGQIFGDIPPYTLDHDLDSGRGRLIPTTAVEQFAYPLGRWFGLSDAEISTALPRYAALGSGPRFI